MREYNAHKKINQQNTNQLCYWNKSYANKLFESAIHTSEG